MLFPNYFERTYPERVLAFFNEDDSCLVSERRGKFWHVSDFRTFVDVVFRENLQVWVSKLIHFPWLYELIAAGEVLCERRGGPKIAFLRGARNTTRWIVQASSWGLQWLSSPILKYFRELFSLCDVGVRQTPSSLGSALMRHWWPYGALRHGEPNAQCIRDLHAHGCGGRAQHVRIVKEEDVYELDRVNAYADAAARWGMPTGSTYTIVGDQGIDSYAAWFCLCRIHSRGVSLSPFGYRAGDAPVIYPTSEGSYDAWLWDFQYTSCLQAGLEVEVIQGHGWREMTYDLALWVEAMSELRKRDSIIKRAIVQALGRFNMQPLKYLLSTQVLDPTIDRPVISDWGQFYQLFVHPVIDNRKWQGPHWYYYNTTRVADATYRLARDLWPHTLAVNFDAVYVEKCCSSVEKLFKPKSECVTGEVGRKFYPTANLLKNRWFSGIDEFGEFVEKTPGVSH